MFERSIKVLLVDDREKRMYISEEKFQQMFLSVDGRQVNSIFKLVDWDL